MGMFCVGAALGSPPGTRTPSPEMTVVTDYGPGANETAALSNVELNYTEAQAPVALGIGGHDEVATVTDGRVVIPGPERTGWVHRWRDYSDDYAHAPCNKIYRPGWKRIVCKV